MLKKIFGCFIKKKQLDKNKELQDIKLKRIRILPEYSRLQYIYSSSNNNANNISNNRVHCY